MGMKKLISILIMVMVTIYICQNSHNQNQKSEFLPKINYTLISLNTKKQKVDWWLSGDQRREEWGEID